MFVLFWFNKSWSLKSRTKNYLNIGDLYYFVFLACVSVLVWSDSPEVIILPEAKLHSLFF